MGCCQALVILYIRREVIVHGEIGGVNWHTDNVRPFLRSLESSTF